MQVFRHILRRVFGSLFLAIVTFVVAPLVAVGVILGSLIFLPLPATIPAARTSPVIEPSVIYDAEGQPIATLAEGSESVPFTEAAVPAVLKEAVISDEDRGFYHEGGVDLRGIVRAFIADLRNDKVVQGASTITEQYVKLAYTNGRRSLWTKIKEAILANQLSRVASKNEILYRYLSIAYFGDGNYGVGAAAENYFHVPVSKLDASQSATLAGLLPAPSARAPREDLGQAELFRGLVLGEMLHQGYLTPAAYRRALAEHLALAGARHVPKTATLVYPPPATRTRYPAFVGYVVQWLKEHFTGAQIYQGGLRIQTTLEAPVQHEAQAAVDSTLSGTADPLEMGLAAVQPQTGFIEAMVGHRSGSKEFADDNFALGGCPSFPASSAVKPTCATEPAASGGGLGRQPGSSWKPFVLATAFEEGIPPSRIYEAPPVYTIPTCRIYPGQPADQCQVHNDEGNEIGAVTLATATWDSLNTVYAQVAPEVGCANVAKTAKAMGVTSAFWSPKVFPYCARYALGELGVSPLDMASAYGVFADHGLRAPATPIIEIVNGEGRILVDNLTHPAKPVRVLPANVANNVTNVLEGVIRYGTGTAADIGRPAAGKTGTASNYTDAWFDGYTPTLATSVWMGDAASEAVGMGVVKGVYPVVGGTWPAMTWRAFMSQALAKVPPTNFSVPAPITPPKALVSPTPTTVPAVQPGLPSYPAGTPSGGPYEGTAPTPGAPPPPPTTTTTVPPRRHHRSGGSTTTTTTTPTTTTTTPSTTTTTVPVPTA